jgi:hypothetical protein
MQVDLIPAKPDQEPILANLLELYLHDFSEFHHLEIGPDGRFGYPNLHLYWNNPDRHAFLIQVNGKLAGFALIKKEPDTPSGQSAWDMAEFFILRMRCGSASPDHGRFAPCNPTQPRFSSGRAQSKISPARLPSAPASRTMDKPGTSSHLNRLRQRPRLLPGEIGRCLSSFLHLSNSPLWG